MTLTATEPTWIGHGACRGIDPVLFHPDRGESTRDAKAVCAACTVRVECLGWALAIDQRHGIYGGTSERERRRMRRRLAAGEPVPELESPPDPPTKEPAVDLAVATTEPAAVTPTNGDRPIDPETGLPTDVCVNCGKRYTPDRKTQRFHSKECARAWYAAHPKGETGERRPRIKTQRKVKAAAKATAVSAAELVAPDAAPPLSGVASGAVDLHSLLGQLLTGCDHWTVDADLGDVHLTVSRGRG